MDQVDYLSLMRQSGRVAVVTGAASGIGRSTAIALAQAGAHVVVTDVDGEAAQRVAAELRSGEWAQLDVSDEECVRHTIGGVADRLGRIDVLVNNVGAAARVPTLDLPTAEWERVLALGPTASFRCAREVGRVMIQARRGSIVNVASIMGLVGSPFYPNLAYHTAKGGVVNMTRALACEWAPFGVRVNAVAPTFARTRMTQGLLADAELRRRLEEATPLGRFVEPEEVAAAILFLAGDAASMITGHVLPVDGGWTAR